MMVALRVLTAIAWLWMLWVIVATSLESNLFVEWQNLSAIPWMRATLWDFYLTMSLVVLWMWRHEPGWASRLCWTLAFLLLGSLGTLFYFWLHLMRLPKHTSLKDVF
ncbi:MAG: DUF1475 family protein [Acidobacteria bacterium]|nr:DUF1475 family protein [Acidobacteriota bacterium]